MLYSEVQWKVKYKQNQIHQVNFHDQVVTRLKTKSERAESLQDFSS